MPSATGLVALEFNKLALGVLEVFPRALGAKFKATAGIRGPAVVPLVKEVVRVCIMRGLHTVVATAVEPALALEGLGPTTAHHMVGSGLDQHPGGDDDLCETISSLVIRQ